MSSFGSFSLIAVSCLCLSIPPAWSTATFDGPAELPRVTVASAMTDTPSPGAIVAVNAGDNLQTALDNAHCGDIIELQAGAVYTGQVILGAVNCDSGHWIMIRT